MTQRTYRGTDVEVSFDADLCIHATECVRGLPAVFDRQRRPWVLADNATAEEVSAVIERCPSGALKYRRLDGAPNEPDWSGHHGHPRRERPLSAARRPGRPASGRNARKTPTGRAVPMRPVEEQAVLRQQPPRSRIPGARSNPRTDPVRLARPDNPVIPT